MRGLDPRIHQKRILPNRMDCRVKPGNDEWCWERAPQDDDGRVGSESPPAHRAFDLTVGLIGRQENVVVVIQPERR